MNFIFFGRLAREKGFDLVVGALSEITMKTGELPGNIFVFGEGAFRENLFREFAETPLFEDCSRLTPAEIADKIELITNFSPLSFGRGVGGEGFEGEECKIFFFGWQTQAIIRSVLEVSHFSLMPSRFLETFGLSALESLSEGVPVIAFQKGGLIPFIPKELIVPFFSDDEKNTHALADMIIKVSEKYVPTDNSVLGPIFGGEWWERISSPFRKWLSSSEEESSRGESWETLSHTSRRIADGYTEARWIQQVREILPENTKKILLASDYTTLFGGIETHVQTIARTLRQHGYEVEIFGWNLSKGRFSKVLRLLGLVYSLCNISSAWGIRKKVREFEPDVIWLHSVSRFLGPLVVREVVNWGENKRLSEPSETCHPERQSRDPFRSVLGRYIQRIHGVYFLNLKELVSNVVFKRDSSTSVGMTKTLVPLGLSNYSIVTYHDLGLLSPFPSRVESEDMIPKNPSLGAFLGTIRSKNPISYLASFCKYFQVCILRKLLKRINIHIVPSAFLVPYIRDIEEISEKQIVVLEHFL